MRQFSIHAPSNSNFYAISKSTISKNVHKHKRCILSFCIYVNHFRIVRIEFCFAFSLPVELPSAQRYKNRGKPEKSLSFLQRKISELTRQIRACILMMQDNE